MFNPQEVEKNTRKWKEKWHHKPVAMHCVALKSGSPVSIACVVKKGIIENAAIATWQEVRCS